MILFILKFFQLYSLLSFWNSDYICMLDFFFFNVSQVPETYFFFSIIFSLLVRLSQFCVLPWSSFIVSSALSSLSSVIFALLLSTSSKFFICYYVFWFCNFHLALFKIFISLLRFLKIYFKGFCNWLLKHFYNVDCLFFKLWFFWFLVC